jgi:hypothetical protein
MGIKEKPRTVGEFYSDAADKTFNVAHTANKMRAGVAADRHRENLREMEDEGVGNSTSVGHNEGPSMTDAKRKQINKGN